MYIMYVYAQIIVIVVVTIRYVPYVGDSKRAMDEYTSEIFMGGKVSVKTPLYAL